MLNFGFYNMDCMEGMKEFPDKYFDLAIVDPPYGGGGHEDAEDTFNGALVGRFGGRFEKYFGTDKRGHMGGGHMKRYEYGHWDIAPSKEYFNELFRVSKNQIIWGGNYFELPPTRCFVIWRKLTISENFTMAMAEYAWTSFNDNAKVFECAPQGKANEKRFHPTQKPVALYEWILNRYAKEGDKILDTHVGSASSLIACRNTNHKYVGFEIDEEYYRQAKERLDRETAQMNIFDFI
jgi:site-specific DNA-methyltransferase (adenine-specific)